MAQMSITCNSTEAMCAVVANLVKEGLTFEVEDNGDGSWYVKLTGGF